METPSKPVEVKARGGITIYGKGRPSQSWTNPLSLRGREPRLAIKVIREERPAPRRDEIAVRAWEIWRSEGSPDGKALEHWLRAEKELGAAA